MNENSFNLIAKQDLVYYGSSDLLAQICDELRNNPESCFARNVMAWYNEAYASLSDNSSCSYQVETDESLCNPNLISKPESIEELVNIMIDFVNGNSANLRRVIIGVACREARRRNIIARGSSVN